MALRALMLRKKIDDKKKELEEVRKAAAGFEKREAELEQAIEEAESEEEKKTVEDAVTEFEGEKAENEKSAGELEETIKGLEAELEEEEKRTKKAEPKPKTKEETKTMVRTKFFGMNMQERDAFFAREDVKTFLGRVREAMTQKRAIENVGLTIPEVMLELMRQVVEENSKLYPLVRVVRISGRGRQVIAGSIPEAVWTEMCANLNELSLGFNDVEIDGYKVGGYFAVCNATLEDNDVNLASEIVSALGKAIAKALDKAVVYGTGTKMPMGIVTRLAQTAKPASYPATAREWTDLSESHMITGSGKSGVALFQEIVGHTGVIENDYFDGEIIFLMNKKTHTKLTVASMDKNMNAAIVAGIGSEMPVIGGRIIELSFIPDDNIVFGYMPAYLLGERAGVNIEQSRENKFIEDQTVFRGTARYDGVPAIAEAFAVCTVSSAAPTTTVTFPADTANA